ncbi:MAG: methionine--tRNA ligase [Chloroflexi bacterium]|nr:methionine--tRNA ligase [Chloroflexota bacterium]
MTERIFIGVAWPYANGPLHLGHIAGAYLPADIFARYHRLKGDQVLMVSGSDAHGTPITLRAQREGVSPEEVVHRYHQQFLDCWQSLGISWDLFTSTETVNHKETTHHIFLKLLDKGYIYKDKMSLPFCPQCQRFLPDRYVEGTCPHCHYLNARGDQCDECGRTLNPWELIDLRCGICGATPTFRDSEHFFLRLTALADSLSPWVREQGHWRENVRHFTLGLLEEGLKDRAITRDITWGVPLPLPDYPDKRIYVWFEAVIGYLSASKEWARLQGDEDKWREFWREPTRAYYFIGKDNIPFHTIIWPAMLIGYDGLLLPYDVPANEFLTLEGRQLSTSRNWAVWLPDYLARYHPDPLRYLLSINMPETGDTDFSWREFVRRNNDELVATYGNLVHRVLTFLQRHFGGAVPAGDKEDDSSQTLVARCQNTLEAMDASLSRCRFREALRSAMALAQETNRYLDEKSPWKTVSRDREAAGAALYGALTAIQCLKQVLYPFLPFSSIQLHQMLGYQTSLEAEGWHFSPVPSGQKLPPPAPLFLKLDEKVVEEETKRLAQISG